MTTLLIRVVRLGLAASCLRLVPMEGLANQSEVFNQFSSIGIKAAWTLLLQMPEANRFSLLHDHIPVISGLAGQKNSKAMESPRDFSTSSPLSQHFQLLLMSPESCM